jgi:colanic acid biosynthesis glycosyl transferase WcaI
VNENSEAARAIHRANCGVIVPAENPEALTAAIVSLKKNPELRRVLGANARAYAEGHFAKAGVLRTYDEFFLNVLCTTGLSPAPEELREG